jgi:2'-5' RNA ligase
MRAAIALILEGEAHATVRRIALELHEEFGYCLEAAQLPAHISLKQVFAVPNLEAIETFFDNFAASLEPIALTLPTLEFWNTDGMMIAYLDVLEDEVLRPIHNRLNAELEARFGNTPAPFDGESYHFHATAAMEYTNPQTLEAQAKRNGERFDVRTTAQHLGLFIYTQDDFEVASFICYKTIALQSNFVSQLEKLSSVVRREQGQAMPSREAAYDFRGQNKKSFQGVK